MNYAIVLPSVKERAAFRVTTDGKFEAMDKAWYTEGVLLDSDKIGKSSIEKDYLKACGIAEIEP